MREQFKHGHGQILPAPSQVVRKEPIIDYLAQHYGDHAGLVQVAIKVKAMMDRNIEVTIQMVDYLFEEALKDKVTEVIAERKKARAQRQVDNKRQGYTYFLKNGDRIKIGFSRNPKGRAESLSLRESNIMGVVESGQQFERMMHDKWAHIRIGNTEWFEATPELLGFITVTAMKWHYRHASRRPQQQGAQQSYTNLARRITGES